MRTQASDASCDAFTVCDEMAARGWYVQPQMSYGGQPPTIHLSVSAATNAHVDEFLGALVMMSKGSSFTLPLIIASARTETSLGGTDWGMLQAGITISIVPCVLVYLLLQRYYVSGLMSGAVK